VVRPIPGRPPPLGQSWFVPSGVNPPALPLIVNPKQYRLSVTASPATYGAVSGAGTFTEGSSVIVNATPNGSHSFVNWTQNGKVVSTSASYMFNMPSANATLTARFK
jgi:hypothetical protein